MCCDCESDGDDVACAFFARGMITGRSEASTEWCSGELVHVTGEIAIAGGGMGKDVDDDPAATATGPGGTDGTAGGTGESLVGGVTSTLGGRRGLAAGDEIGVCCCEPLGVEEDGRAECLRAPRTGMGGASGGSGRRVGVRMRVLREGLAGDRDERLDVAQEGVGEFERPDGPSDVDSVGVGVGSGAGSGGCELVSSPPSGCCSLLLSLFSSGSQGSYTSLGTGAGANLISDGCRGPLSVGTVAVAVCPGSAGVSVS